MGLLAIRMTLHTDETRWFQMMNLYIPGRAQVVDSPCANWKLCGSEKSYDFGFCVQCIRYYTKSIYYDNYADYHVPSVYSLQFHDNIECPVQIDGIEHSTQGVEWPGVFNRVSHADACSRVLHDETCPRISHEGACHHVICVKCLDQTIRGNLCYVGREFNKKTARSCPICYPRSYGVCTCDDKN